MKADKKEYKIVDQESGETIRLVFTHNYCGCTSPGCVDDVLEAYEEDDDDIPYRLEIPRLMTHFIEGLLDGSYKVKE